MDKKKNPDRNHPNLEQWKIMAKAIIMIIVLNYNEIPIIIIQWFKNMC